MGATYGLIAAPFVWVCLEYARSNLGFLALPFPILAHTQHQFLSIIQIASFAGAYGISFLIVLVNAAIALLLLSLVYRQGKNDLSQKQFISNFGRNAVVGFAALLVILALLYGSAAVKKPLSEKRIKISVLQGNIDQEKKSNQRKHAGFIMQRYAELTEKASLDRPDLIAWPEAATPGFVLKDSGLLRQMRVLIRKHKVPFIVGSSEYCKFSKVASDKGKVGNTALFFSPEGKLLGQYLKMRLIPFGEYIPFDGVIPWPRFIVPEGKRSYEVPGKDYTLFEIGGHKFGVVICSEGAFPGVFRKFVKKGAHFMLNLTNEGWFGETALYQKVAASVFRAVENGISIARATNTGISCFIDPYGRVTGKVRNNGRETLVEGYLTKEITVSEEKTLFTVYGDLFAYLSILITVVAVVLSFRKARK
jgi:apolipoprotein N-acyltransferase